MPDSTKAVANSFDLYRGAHLARVFVKEKTGIEELPTVSAIEELASRLEAIEKDAGLKKAVKYLNFYFRDKTPDVRVPAERSTLLVLTALLSLVPSLYKEW